MGGRDPSTDKAIKPLNDSPVEACLAEGVAPCRLLNMQKDGERVGKDARADGIGKSLQSRRVEADFW